MMNPEPPFGNDGAVIDEGNQEDAVAWIQQNASLTFIEDSFLSRSNKNYELEDIRRAYKELLETKQFATEEERTMEAKLISAGFVDLIEENKPALITGKDKDGDEEEDDDFVLLDDDIEEEPVMVERAADMEAEKRKRDGHKFRVLTYNVNWGMARDGVGGIRSKRVCQAIIESNADVCVLQETHSGWQSMLKREVSHLYPYQQFVHCDPAGGLGFLCRYPITKPMEVRSNVEGSLFPSALIQFEHPTSGKRVQVVNVHLRPPVCEELPNSEGQQWEGWRSGIRNRLGFMWGMLAAQISTPTVRFLEAKSIISSIDQTLPSILAGDFNESEDGRALTYIRSLGAYRNALRQYDPKTPTWRWPTPVMVLQYRFDHILYTKYRLRCNGAKVMPGYWQDASDHMPVVAAFEFLEQNHANKTNNSTTAAATATYHQRGYKA